jgi:hypothetical protein
MFSGFGALPMYFDLMGPHFVIAIRSTLAGDWYEALEYHWLALFNMVSCIFGTIEEIYKLILDL